MAWRSINDPFCGHLCSDGVMVPQKKAHLPHKLDINPRKSLEVVEEDQEGLETHIHGGMMVCGHYMIMLKPLKMS